MDTVEFRQRLIESLKELSNEMYKAGNHGDGLVRADDEEFEQIADRVIAVIARELLLPTEVAEGLFPVFPLANP